MRRSYSSSAAPCRFRVVDAIVNPQRNARTKNASSSVSETAATQTRATRRSSQICRIFPDDLQQPADVRAKAIEIGNATRAHTVNRCVTNRRDVRFGLRDALLIATAHPTARIGEMSILASSDTCTPRKNGRSEGVFVFQRTNRFSAATDLVSNVRMIERHFSLRRYLT